MKPLPDRSETTLFGFTADQWLDIREERDRYQRALEDICTADVRGKRKVLLNIAAKALEPTMPPSFTRDVRRMGRRMLRRPAR